MTATLTKTKSKRQERFLSVGRPYGNVFALKLAVGKISTGYYVERLGDQIYRVEKFSSDTGSDGEEREYYVNLADAEHGCSCRGYLRHSHCKHFDALTTLAHSQ